MKVFFGYFKGMPYEGSKENFESYRQLHNSLPKETIYQHMNALEKWLTSLPTKDIFTGEKLQGGLCEDGDFVFPLDFLHYYKDYDIGIPYEYEEYLKSIGVG